MILLKEFYLGDTTSMEPKPNPHKGMTPPPTQNFKTIDLQVLFLISCSTLSSLSMWT